MKCPILLSTGEIASPRSRAGICCKLPFPESPHCRIAHVLHHTFAIVVVPEQRQDLDE